MSPTTDIAPTPLSREEEIIQRFQRLIALCQEFEAFLKDHPWALLFMPGEHIQWRE